MISTRETSRQTRAESRTGIVEQINACLRSGDYARALDLSRSAAAEFPNDAELSRLEKLAQDGAQRKAEADRLITESQELFAQQKSAQAIQLLREASALDKNNSLARAILANALVEHAQSIVETDWWEAETLTNEALGLNRAHPTARTIHNLIIDQKKAGAVEEWVSQTRKLQASGNLNAALSQIAEGFAVYPREPRLLEVQNELQREHGARRRQDRRRDLEDLRRMASEIDAVADVAANKTLTDRIRTLTTKHSTDGEILSVANALLLRLGQLGVPQKSEIAAAKNDGSTVIDHAATKAPAASIADTGKTPAIPVLPIQAPPGNVPLSAAPMSITPPDVVEPDRVPPSVVGQVKVPSAPPEAQLAPTQAADVPVAKPPAPAAEIALSSSPVTASSQPTSKPKAKVVTPILISAAAIIVIAATFFFARQHNAPSSAKTPVGPTISPAPTVAAPAVSASTVPAPPQTIPEALPAPRTTPADAGKIAHDDQPPAIAARRAPQVSTFVDGRNESGHDESAHMSTLVVAEPQHQPVQPKLAPQPRVASLTIQGGAPGTAVLVDQTLFGTIQPDGTFSLSTVNPGDRSVELRRKGFKPRQLKEHFVAGGAVSLAAADAALEAAPGELKITFAPADAKVAIVKGESLTGVSNGVPLDLAAGTYTLTARNADGFARSSTLEIVAGQFKELVLSLAPNGMSKWDDPGAWKQEGNAFTRKGGDFVLFGAVPASGTFAFSAMPTKGHVLQWVVNYTDPKNYVLFQMDDNNFYRTVIRNGEKMDKIIVPDQGGKKSFTTLHIRVSATEIVHQIKHGNSWTVLDRSTQPGTNLSLGKFGFYLPGSDQIAVSGFAHYADLNIR